VLKLNGMYFGSICVALVRTMSVSEIVALARLTTTCVFSGEFFRLLVRHRRPIDTQGQVRTTYSC
jgi:hypothetical protein